MNTLVKARELRRDMTDVERVLWRLLRSRQLSGFKFRRQQPIEHCIADFVCFAHRLIVEINRGQHALEVEKDERRTHCLEKQGFRVIRFWNTEVMENAEGVCLSILEALRETPHPGATRFARRRHPSPARGEGW